MREFLNGLKRVSVESPIVYKAKNKVINVLERVPKASSAFVTKTFSSWPTKCLVTSTASLTSGL